MNIASGEFKKTRGKRGLVTQITVQITVQIYLNRCLSSDFDFFCFCGIQDRGVRRKLSRAIACCRYSALCCTLHKDIDSPPIKVLYDILQIWLIRVVEASA